MGNDRARGVIRVRGARQNNLQGIDLDLPTGSLVVVTGLSGSGKSSLAFDTLYAEGQRRYIETFSPYARQFFDRMDKPRVDLIEGIPPAVALEQRNSVRTTRSTVGTMTEVCDYLKVLWPRLARLHCRGCGNVVQPEHPRDVWQAAPSVAGDGGEVLVLFELPLTERLSISEQLALIARQGFQRLLVEGGVVRLEEAAERLQAAGAKRVMVVQDRLRVGASGPRARFVEACEQAYHFGHGKLQLARVIEGTGAAAKWGELRRFSRHLHCAKCDLEYDEPTAALFSYNHPVGACPECKGFGRVIGIDYQRAIPDRTKTLAGGAVKPWQTETGAECQQDMVKFARREKVPLDVPFRDLSDEHQRWVVEGEPDYGPGNEWPHAWYGVRGYFKWLETKAYKMHVRVLLSKYRSYRTCPSCGGARLRPDALLWRLPAGGPGAGLSLADFYALPAEGALRVVESLTLAEEQAGHDPLALALGEVRARLGFLNEVGLGYLALHRATRTLSGGETQRVNLTTCLGSRLVNTLFVLDEPSVGLHARDTDRLVGILLRLRDLGNTVVVVEHESAVMRAADHLIDIGPGHGESGGRVVAQGSLAEVLRSRQSLTADYLSGRRRMEVPARRPVTGPGPGESFALRDQLPGSAAVSAGAGAMTVPFLELSRVTRHNLRDVTVRIPLGRLVGLSGVSGSGKSTLAGELLARLREQFGLAASRDGLEVQESEKEEGGGDETDDGTAEEGGGGRSRLTGTEALGGVLLVDQSPIGRTPRSNPAVYVGAFDYLRDLFARTPVARERGLNSSAFSFNSKTGQCEHCRGAGFEKIEMQFLSDVFIRCPECNGRRYRPHILEIRIEDPADATGARAYSIADLLELSVDEALALLERLKGSAAVQAADRLRLVQEVGLGYLHLGQAINTLSGGESQRLKLAGHLAGVETGTLGARTEEDSAPDRPSLFIFDEPTTGLHFEDVRILLRVFQRLVDAGHSVLIIEHHLDVLKSADWIIDLGPDGGSEGGRVVVAGTPEEVAACAASHTGRALKPLLEPAVAR